MHLSPDAMKTLAFVLLMLLVAVYMHLSYGPRRQPRSLVDITRHRLDQGDTDASRDETAPDPAQKGRS